MRCRLATGIASAERNLNPAGPILDLHHRAELLSCSLDGKCCWLCQAIVSVEGRWTSLKIVVSGHGSDFSVATEGRFANHHWDEECLVSSQVWLGSFCHSVREVVCSVTLTTRVGMELSATKVVANSLTLHAIRACRRCERTATRLR